MGYGLKLKKMKKNIQIAMIAMMLSFGIATSAWAQEGTSSVAPRQDEAEGLFDCDWIQRTMGYPYYYCTCKNTTQEFNFGLDLVINDTMWFTASVDQLKQGLSAYWFSTSTVTMDVFGFCTSTAPSFTMTVGGNTMREMDVTRINQKLDEMGAMAQMLSQVVTPRVRVYPNNGGSGRVMCYPYNQGPHSTCADPLSVVIGMTYVSNHNDEVYRMQPGSTMANDLFIQWKEEHNRPCSVSITRDSCNGPVVASTTLNDSSKVFFPGTDIMSSARTGNYPLFFHFAHNASNVGRITFRRGPKFVADTISAELCHGKYLQLVDTALRESTIYIDTTWQKKDSFLISRYELTVLPVEDQYDTLNLTYKQLPYSYRNTRLINSFGDYDVLVQRNNECDEHYLLHVTHNATYITDEQHATVCLGKTYTMKSGVVISRDTAVVDSIWRDRDTCAITDISIVFTLPETEYDTAYVRTDSINMFYYMGKPYRQFGDHDIVYTRKNTCTRYIHLTIVEKPIPPTGLYEAQAAARRARKVVENGTIYIERDGVRFTLLGGKATR